VNILPLHRRPDLVRPIAGWHNREWRHFYHDWDIERAVRTLQAEPRDGRLPQTLLALENDRLLGTIAVVFNDLPGREDLNPWVASFYVSKEARGRGVGRSLLAAAEDLLRAAGVAQAFLFTGSAQRYFEQYGWRALEPAMANGHSVLIMTKNFRAP
jgi:GNAT superfamily N-acetyltransferase